MLTRQQAVEFLTKEPVKFAHMLGFTRLGELHNGWIHGMVCGSGDTTLMAHRASYKTTCVSVALSLIMLLLPRLRTVFIRKTDTDVKEVVKQVQKILLDPHTQYFASVIYGTELKLVTQSATEIHTNLANDTKGTVQLMGIGIGGSLTGKHFDRIFTDDIINVQDRISKAERDRTKLVYQELQNIKNRGGRIYNTLTPWHPDDASVLMPEAQKFDCYTTGLLTKEEIEQIRSKMLPSLFAANYELRHIASENVIFPTPNVDGDPAMLEQGVAHVDAAYGGDDSTAFTLCRKYDGKYYVLGKLWHKHVDDCLDDIISLRAMFNAGKIYIETNGDKGYLSKELRKRGERTFAYHEDMNKFMKITSYLKFAWNDVIFVRGTDPEYIRQICDYTEDAEHDDAPDSLASMIRALYRKKDGTEGAYVSPFERGYSSRSEELSKETGGVVYGAWQ